MSGNYGGTSLKWAQAVIGLERRVRDAMIDQDARIESLKKENSELKKRVARLESSVDGSREEILRMITGKSVFTSPILGKRKK